MDIYGLIGGKLGHSLSAELFNRKFQKEGIEASYELHPLDSIDRLPDWLDSELDLKGFNVTVPYKEAVIPLLDELTPLASTVGAVNAVRVEFREGRRWLVGHNTDVAGFRDALAPMLIEHGHAMGERYALVLGSGGASKAVAAGLRELCIEPRIVSRTRKKGRIRYSDLTPELVYEAEVVVNATPLGTFPDTMASPPFPFQYLSKNTICFDLVYNPEKTLFMRICEAHGCRVTNGLAMLHGQAEAAWRFWNSADS